MFKVTENKRIARARSFPNSRYNAKTRIYVFQAKETILDNLINRRSRPRDLYRALVEQVYPELTRSMRWSQKAGCSCGCSPGFIVDHTVREDGKPVDIFITSDFTEAL